MKWNLEAYIEWKNKRHWYDVRKVLSYNALYNFYIGDVIYFNLDADTERIWLGVGETLEDIASKYEVEADFTKLVEIG